MKKKYFGWIKIFLIALALIFACTAERHSVFHALITDTEEVDGNLGNDISIIGMTKDDSGLNYFLAAAGALWQREVAGNSADTPPEWSKVALPDDAALLCTAFIGHGSALYAGFSFEDNSFGLYRGSFAADPGWQKQTDAEILDKQVTKLFSLNGNTELFASVKENGTFALYYSADGSDFVETGISGSYPVTSLILVGTTYWAVTRDDIYQGSAPDSINTSLSGSLPVREENEGYQAVYYSAAEGRYFLSLNNGWVYESDDGGATWDTWPTEAPAEEDTNVEYGPKMINSDTDISFTEIAEIDSTILVGSLNNGFYQAKDSDIISLTHTDALASEINSCSVLRFYVDTSENLVFFLTVGYGLYRNSYTDTAKWGNYVRE